MSVFKKLCFFIGTGIFEFWSWQSWQVDEGCYEYYANSRFPSKSLIRHYVQTDLPFISNFFFFSKESKINSTIKFKIAILMVVRKNSSFCSGFSNYLLNTSVIIKNFLYRLGETPTLGMRERKKNFWIIHENIYLIGFC